MIEQTLVQQVELLLVGIAAVAGGMLLRDGVVLVLRCGWLLVSKSLAGLWAWATALDERASARTQSRMDHYIGQRR